MNLDEATLQTMLLRQYIHRGNARKPQMDRSSPHGLSRASIATEQFSSKTPKLQALKVEANKPSSSIYGSCNDSIYRTPSYQRS
jgi:hypothetical protein